MTAFYYIEYHKDALSIFLAAAFMTVILVWCHRLTIGVSTWISLIFEILVAGIVYFCCIFMFKNTISKKLVTSYGGYQCLIIAVLFFCALLGTDTKNSKITFIIHSVAKYSFGMYLISWPIDIVVYKVMNVLMPQSAQMYLLPISIFCVSVCSYIGAIIVTKIADVLIQIAGFFAKSQKRMR